MSCSAIRLPSIPFTDVKTEIPACQPCQNSGSICDYTDGRSGDVYPRSYIHDLEAQLIQLESQLREVDDAATTEVSPPTSTLRSDDEPAQDLIRVGDEGHAHFIGASSGRDTQFTEIT